MKTCLRQTCMLCVFVFFSLGISAQSNQDLAQADSIERILLTEKEDSSKLSRYFLLLSIYSDEGLYNQAIETAYSCLHLAEKLKEKISVGASYNSLAVGYNFLNDGVAAKKYIDLALHIFEEEKDTAQFIRSSIFSTQFLWSEGKYLQTEKIRNHALQLAKQLNHSKWALAYAYEWNASMYSDMADLSQKAGKESEAKILAQRAVKFYDSTMPYWGTTAEVYTSIGYCYKTIGEFDIAKKYLLQGLRLAQETSDRKSIGFGMEYLSEIYSYEHNYEAAYNYYKQSKLIRDSLFGIETSRKALQQKMQYDFEKKEAVTKAEQDKKDAEAKRIKLQQYYVIASLGIAVLAVVIIAVIQYRSKQNKHQANITLQQQKEKVESTLSELKSTQQQLMQSEKMASLGELTAGIAHEIQNPLNFVNNFSEVNREMIDEANEEIDKGNIEEVKNILNDIKDNEEKINHHGKRADSIVKGMLQHSRQTKALKESTDINALCDEYLRLSYHGLRAKDKSFNADFKTNFDETIGKINIVPQDIGRVLLNLFNNAFYATNSKQKTADENYKAVVSIQTKKANDKIEIRVSDNGNGIPQNIIDKIFHPFFTTKPTGQGTGLGLSLSYDIITKEHNGSIKVESKEGEGTMFIINLPLV